MRFGATGLALAFCAVAVSGCLTTGGGDSGGGTAAATSGSSTTSTSSNTGLSGSTAGTGGANATVLASGNTALAFTPNGRSPSTGGLATVSFANTGTPNETATVTVDPKNTVGWGPADTLPVFSTGTTGLGANYSEYRKITATSDSELQYWQYTNSFFAQYRDVSNGGGSDAFAAWFFGGSETTLANMPVAGTATYNGQFTATAETSNWTQITGGTYDPNGLWRLRGTSVVNADFAAGTVTGTLTPNHWEKFDNGNTIVVDAANPERYVFHDTNFNLQATITDNKFAGTTTATNATTSYVNGDNPVHGGFYGAAANEVTGIFATYAKVPVPSGANIGINDDRRGNVDVQGGFHGQ